MQPLVSWLMPVYNCKNNIERALDSIIKQTYANYEVIIVLEHLTDDDMVRVCRTYASKDSRFKLIYNQERLGIAKSLNVGLSCCKGKYIARMGVDDYSYPDRLKLQVGYLEENQGVVLLGGDVDFVNERTGKRKSVYSEIPSNEKIKAYLLFNNCIIPSSVMFRNYEGISYPESSVGDYALFAQLSTKVKIEIMPQVVLEHYQSNSYVNKVMLSNVRKESCLVSREMIKTELGIDTADYDDSYFGWCDMDDMPEEPEQFLIKGEELYRKILSANIQKKIIDEGALSAVVNEKWRGTLKLVSPYFLSALEKPFFNINKETICRTFAEMKEKTSNKTSNKRIVIYGTGAFCRGWFTLLSEDQKKSILCFCDSSKQKQGNTLDGIEIVSPEELPTKRFEYIAIASRDFYDEIETEIIELGIEREKIIDLPIPCKVKEFHKVYSGYMKKYRSLNEDRHAFLFCAADYRNIGDHAIAEAEHAFVKEVLGMELIEVPCFLQRCFMKILRKTIKPTDLIFISGGGFLGSLWPVCENNSKEVIQSFPDNPILIFPQTLYWENGSEEQAQETYQIYKGHKNVLVLCARDYVTQKLMHRYYPKIEIIEAPDMVLSQDWHTYFKQEERHGIFICLKKEKESILSELDKMAIRKMLRQYDKEITEDDNHFISNFYEENRKAILIAQLRKFATSALVVTDRLHGMIFSIITNTPCIVLNNCNHKLKASYERLRKCENLRFAEKLEEIPELIPELLTKYVDIEVDWKDDFSKLKTRCKEMVKNEPNK